jgi:hypothetical protein
VYRFCFLHMGTGPLAHIYGHDYQLPQQVV